MIKRDLNCIVKEKRVVECGIRQTDAGKMRGAETRLSTAGLIASVRGECACRRRASACRLTDGRCGAAEYRAVPSVARRAVGHPPCALPQGARSGLCRGRMATCSWRLPWELYLRTMMRTGAAESNTRQSQNIPLGGRLSFRGRRRFPRLRTDPRRMRWAWRCSRRLYPCFSLSMVTFHYGQVPNSDGKIIEIVRRSLVAKVRAISD